LAWIDYDHAKLIYNELIFSKMLRKTVIETSKKMLFFCLIVSLFWFSLYTYVPIVPTYAVDLGSNLLFVGIITGSYGLMQMLFRIPVGIASDRLGTRKPFIIGGVVFATLAGLTVVFSQSPISLLICRIFGGIAACAWVPLSVHFSLQFKSEEGAKSMGIINAVNSTGIVLAVFLCGIVVNSTGRVGVFIIAIGAGLIALVLSLFIKEPIYQKAVPLSLAELIKVPFESNILLISALGFISQYMTFATIYGFTPIIAKKLEASDSQVGLLLTFFILPAIFSSLLSGILNKRIGSRLVLSASFIMFAVDCLLTPFVRGVISLFVMTVIGGFAQGLIFSLLMGIIIKIVTPEKRNTTMGFYQSVYGLGIFLGPVIVGIFSNYFSINWGFAFTALIGFAAAGMSWRIRE
jgi:MFS family permease